MLGITTVSEQYERINETLKMDAIMAIATESAPERFPVVFPQPDSCDGKTCFTGKVG